MAKKVLEKIPGITPRPVEGHKPAAAVLRGVVDAVYGDAWDAKQRGELVGWSSSKFPIELAKAFDLQVVYPENHAATTAAKKDGLRLCNTAEDMGYDNDICGYARISLAFAAGEPTDARKMPQPDFVLCCNNICNMMTKWYENIARIHNIPMIMIDFPFQNTKDVSEEKIDYMVGQFEHAIHQLEELTGKKFDEEKFNAACDVANRTAAAWLKACSYMAYKPSPLSGFDLFNHMADIVAARCDVRAAEGFELLAEEFEQSVREGTSTWEYPEEHRILFEGIPCWPALRPLFEPLKNAGVNVTAVVYAPAFGFQYDGIREMAAAYSKAPCSVCIEDGVEWRETMAKENGISGALVNYNRSCKPWSGAMPEIERRWKEDLDIPVVHFDGDQADERNFSEEQYKTRVQGLVEIMDERKEAREAAGEEVYTNFDNTKPTDWSKPTI
ncbi:2-hydroxyacyl-CoA dehydratase subunit D [Peptoniphilus equinus]|uniref:2-hydroxyacyl-CoA dehydratase subunit D n=1 Tax=Peptoniphilus equinus TaxID=3016343 RepID=A0ABY7QVL3_9FIRM|nr:2-hydroxyacyl-CoA dehydratase subunit D [Peptoniphilus equinus]WBW49948.1 2-hydroxyacyl-CoA dehydratase subunit D [Peptoniphilus equinus]